MHYGSDLHMRLLIMIFAQILLARFKSPIFQERALKYLDEYIKDINLGFSAEHVISVIDDGNFIRTTPSIPTNNFPRLRKASKNRHYSNVMGTIDYDNNENIFPIELVHFCRYSNSNIFYSTDKLMIQPIATRLKNEFNIPYSLGKTLLAIACGFKNGHQLQRFSDLLSVYLTTWSFIGQWFILDESLFENAISQVYNPGNWPVFIDESSSIDPKVSQYHSHFNDPIASMVVNASNIGEMIPTNSDITNSNNFKSALNEGLEVYHIQIDSIDADEYIFYQQLYNLTLSKKVALNKKTELIKDLIRRSIYIELFHLSVVKPIIFLENNSEYGVFDVLTGAEARYNFYHASVGGNNRSLSTPILRKYLDRILKNIGIKFNPETSATAYFGRKKTRINDIKGIFN